MTYRILTRKLRRLGCELVRQAPNYFEHSRFVLSYCPDAVEDGRRNRHLGFAVPDLGFPSRMGLVPAHQARMKLATTLFEQAKMNSAIFSRLNGGDQELVLSLSKGEDALQGVLQPTMDARTNCASLCNASSA